jgi:hypothetical protein
MLEVFIEKFDTNFEPFAKQATQVNIIWLITSDSCSPLQP